MISDAAMKFWDHPDFKRQQELIAGSVPWELSEQKAPLHRQMIETPAIADYLKNYSRPTVVEIGCGVGRLLKVFRQDYWCIGLDISPNMLDKAREYLDLETEKSCDLRLITSGVLPLENECARFVYSFLVFQHIQTKKEIQSYMKEVERALQPGGLFRVQTMRGQPHLETAFGGFHGRFYPTLSEFGKELLSGTSLTVEESHSGLGHPQWFWLTLRKKA